MKKDKYKLIKEDSIKNIIEFLDEIQFEAAKLNTTDAHHQVNFCNWAINELLNSYNVMTLRDSKKSKDDSKKGTNKKSRDQYVDETFMDWNLPEMTDEEYENLVDQFDAFLRGWEKEYYKDNPKKKSEEDRKDKEGKEWKPRIEDVSEHCSLEEIKEFLLDDPELSDEERFDLYYDERERRKPKEKGLSYKQLLKAANLKPPTKK